VSAFADQSLLALNTNATLVQLLDPPGDPTHARMRALVSAMYDMPFAQIHDVRAVVVRRKELERAAFPPRENRGDITRTSPAYERSDVRFEEVDRLAPLWVDLAAELDVELVIEFDAGEIESVLTRAIEGFTSLAQFRANFAFIDLDDFMERHGITTAAELRDAFDYLKVEVRTRTPDPFDPNDPANRIRFTVNVALLFRDAPLDVGESLRAAKLARAVLERTVAAPRESEEASVRRPFVPVVVFPANVVSGGNAPFNAAQVQSLFGSEGVVAVFR
jgi:hypothetical protein